MDRGGLLLLLDWRMDCGGLLLLLDWQSQEYSLVATLGLKAGFIVSLQLVVVLRWIARRKA